VFEFIKRREAMDFPGAVRLLAERARLPLPQRSPAAEKRELERQALYYAGELAQRYYESCLKHRQFRSSAPCVS